MTGTLFLKMEKASEKELYEKIKELERRNAESEERERQTKERERQTKERAEERDREFQQLKAQTKEREQALEQQVEEEKERAENSQRETRPTTLAEYLEVCQRHLTDKISVQTDKSMTTHGDPSNATGKYRPDYLQPWKNFLDTQQETLEQLFSSYPDYTTERAFESLHFVQGLGKRTSDRKLASEMDLHTVIRQNVETPLMQIFQHIRTKDAVQRVFGLPKDFEFENHTNTLSDQGHHVGPQPGAQPPSTPPNPKPPKPAPFNPDQVCVYTTVENLRKPAVIAEFKAPHKLTLPVLRHVLDPDGPEIELEGIINQVSRPSLSEADAKFDCKAKEVVAAVLSQAFSYMVASEVKYGYVTTAEAFVFLRIQWEEEHVKRLHYHLAEPSKDVLVQKEYFLYRTAIGQLLAFSILALQSVKEGGEWRDEAVRGLETWRTDVSAMLKQMAETPSTAGKSSVTEYKPQGYRERSPIASPISRRLRTSKKACGPGPTSQPEEGGEPSSDDEPSRPEIRPRPQAIVRGKGNQQARSAAPGGPSHGVRHRSFCTQLCLQGLARGGPLDWLCPNVSDHCKEGHCKEGYQGIGHQLACEAFLTLLAEQLQRSRRDACCPLGIQGARGALFKVTLPSHGYTVVAKGTILAFVQDLRHEAEVYRRLTSIQGVHIPIFLGSLELQTPFYYDAGVLIMYLMLLSWSGECLGHKTLEGIDRPTWKSDLVSAVDAIHAAGVVHRDLRTYNLLWNEELKRVMVIDFERAQIVKGLRRVLSPCSPNRERKRPRMAKTDSEENIVDVNDMTNDEASIMWELQAEDSRAFRLLA